MSILKNKGLVKLIVSICLFLTIMSFGMANPVYADGEIWGGTLLQPIIRLLTGLGDGIMDILHETIIQQDVTLIKIDGSGFWLNFAKVVLAVIAAVLLITVAATGVGIFVEAGILALTGTAVLKIVTVILISGIGVGVVVGEKIEAEWIPNDVYLPMYTLTPEEIFSNEVQLFDVNFFEPMEARDVEGTVIRASDMKIYVQEPKEEEEEYGIGEYDNELSDGLDEGIAFLYEETSYNTAIWGKFHQNIGLTRILEQVKPYKNEKWPEGTLAAKIEFDAIDIISQYQNKDAIIAELERIIETSYNKYKEQHGGTIPTADEIEITYDLCTLQTDSWENMSVADWPSSGTGIILNYAEEFIIYIILGIGIPETGVVDTIESTAYQLRGIVSSWYFTLRNLALLVLMLVLIYSGIRIVIGSTAGEKAKYKERLMDWLVAMCLIFVMHYIMVFAVELNESFVQLAKKSVGQNGVVKAVGLGDESSTKYTNASGMAELQEYIVSENVVDEDGDTETIYSVIWETDLMGGMRINLQESKEGTAKWVGCAICFLVLVAYTCFFTWTYLKRVLYLTFLTIIAPLVAMTYPIDKITDGKAQAFNSWLKEYIFNLLIQPMHLILYTLLISMAYELAAKNILYALVAMGFMMPAEKLIRKFFGFEKAQTPGLLGGAAGSALAMTGMQSLMRFGQNSKGEAEKDDGENDKLRFSSSEGVSPMDEMSKEAQEDTEGNLTEGIQFNMPQLGGEKQSQGNGPGAGNRGTYTAEEYDEDPTRDYYGHYSPQGTGIPTTSVTPEAELSAAQLRNSRKPDAIKAKSTYDPDKRKKRIRRTMKAMGASYKRQLREKASKRLEKARPIRSLARGALGLAGGAAFGIAGLALGIASGDPSKAFQYASTGALGGYQAGKGIAGAAVDTLSVSKGKLRDEMELEWYGEDYKKAKLEEQKKKLLENEDYITYIRKLTGASRDEAIGILQGTGSDCLDSGIGDVESIIAVDQMTKDIVEKSIEENADLTDEELRAIEEEARKHSIAMQKLSDRLPTDIQKMGEKKIEAYRKQFQKELEEKLAKQIQGELEEKIEASSGQQIRESVRKQLVSGGEKIYSEDATKIFTAEQIAEAERRGQDKIAAQNGQMIDIYTSESRDKMKRLTKQQITKIAKSQITTQATAQSKSIMAGITELSSTKSKLREV